MNYVFKKAAAALLLGVALTGCSAADKARIDGNSDEKATETKVECHSGGVSTYSGIAVGRITPSSTGAYLIMDKASGKAMNIPINECYLTYGYNQPKAPSP